MSRTRPPFSNTIELETSTVYHKQLGGKEKRIKQQERNKKEFYG
jgi:hypothetical protein